MWRMGLVAAIATVVYLAVPLASPGPPSGSDSDSFGKPWTLDSLTAALRERGISVELAKAEGTNELLPGLRGPALTAAGKIGVFPGSIAVYATRVDRLRIWREDRGYPDVWAKGYGRIPEDHAWGLGNAVLFISTLVDQYDDQHYISLRSAVAALRQR